LIGLATEGGTILEGDSGETITLTGDTQIADGDQVLVLGRLDASGESLRVIHTEPVR
jgi:Trk K+ transport system NAD-binding subunit